MRLLLDAHIALAVASRLREVGLDVVAVRDWLDGTYREASDEEVLTRAFDDQRILVTFDCRTNPPLLKRRAETGVPHAGVILVDQKTLRPSDIGGLVRAIQSLVDRSGDDDWTDRVIFLRTP